MNTVYINRIPSKKDLVNSKSQYQVLSEWASSQSKNMRPGSINSVPPVSSYFGGSKSNYYKQR